MSGTPRSRASSSAPRRRSVALAAIPFLASGFDYAENACAWLALAAHPAAAPTDGLLVLSSGAKAVTSWLAGGLLIAPVVALGVLTVWRRLRSPRTDG